MHGGLLSGLTRRSNVALTHQNCDSLLTCCLTYFATRRIVRREQHNVTRQISMTTRKELVAALQVRYRSSGFGERIRILDEFVALTGYRRKHAIRLLREVLRFVNSANGVQSRC